MRNKHEYSNEEGKGVRLFWGFQFDEFITLYYTIWFLSYIMLCYNVTMVIQGT